MTALHEGFFADKLKTDLVILLTPTIMGPGQVIANTASELRRLDTAQKAAEKKAR